MGTVGLVEPAEQARRLTIGSVGGGIGMRKIGIWRNIEEEPTH